MKLDTRLSTFLGAKAVKVLIRAMVRKNERQENKARAQLDTIRKDHSGSGKE